MNRFEADILLEILSHDRTRQRDLAGATGYSLGLVNRSLKSLVAEGMLESKNAPTAKALEHCRKHSPNNAIILAAGLGMRMAPINVLGPKGLLEVHGEPMVERIIKQLHEAGIFDIAIVVGFMKERFEYLIDEYGVDLVVNTDYIARNNLWSLALASDRISNTYIIPCDIWCSHNPFRQRELYSWYIVTDASDPQSEVRVNRKLELQYVQGGTAGNAPVGIAYIDAGLAPLLKERLSVLSQDSCHNGSFWEEALRGPDRMVVDAMVWDARSVVEVNSYEQLRVINGEARDFCHEAVAEAAAVLGVATANIGDIEILKKGVTNSTFSFTAYGTRYAMRIPAEDTGDGGRWQREADAIAAVTDLGIYEPPLFLDTSTGHKIARYMEESHTCDPTNDDDLDACIVVLKKLHDAQLMVPATFDPFDAIEDYERGWNGTGSIFRDYAAVKERVMALRPFAERHSCTACLAHLDPVPENFLIAEKDVQLIDWEYAAMCDPHIDLALLCIHSTDCEERANRLIDRYFSAQGGCSDAARAKVYIYIAACGLVWSNWCELMWRRGIEFGEYSLKLYRHAKEYSIHAHELISSLGEERKSA